MRKLAIRVIAILGFAGLLTAVPAQANDAAASIELDQPDMWWDAPMHIRMRGLEPDRVVTVAARHNA